jgi:hypothetical protein
MLAEFWEQELQSVITREFARLQSKVGSQVSSRLSDLPDQLKNTQLFGQEEFAKLVDVSTEELTERLKRSQLGRRLLAELGDDAQPIFDELGRRYEVVGDRFTESFRQHSRWWATGVALVLALAVNIDSIHIANSYIRSQTLRKGAIAQMDAIVANYEAQVAAVDDTEGPVSKETLRKAISESREQVLALTTIGFPIGWSYFPHAGLKAGKSVDFERRNNPGGWLMWVFGIVLTGILAGLGAPFWYDTVTGISRVVQRARVARKPGSGTASP